MSAFAQGILTIGLRSHVENLSEVASDWWSPILRFLAQFPGCDRISVARGFLGWSGQRERVC
jgi:hypothetical protein